MKKILISIILILAFASNAISATFTSRDIKQPSETKLFISDNISTIKDAATSKNISVSGNTLITTSYIKNGKYSIYFDGTGDYLSIPDSTDLDAETEDFTFDLWIYNKSNVTSNNTYVAGKYYAVGNQRGYYVAIMPSNRIEVDYSPNGTNVYALTSSVTGLINSWNHVAFVKTGTTVKYFLNGVLQDEDTGVTNIYNNNQPFVAGTISSPPNPLYFYGYLQDIRITKGRALWTSNFTPPRRSGAF